MSRPIRRFFEAPSLHTATYDQFAPVQVAASTVAGDIEFYRELAAETGGPILDLGCGTGRVSIELARDGHDVVGVDLSEPMLVMAEQHRRGLPPEVTRRLTFARGDMTALSLGREFGLIVTPFRSFQSLQTPEAQREALTRMGKHLRPNGLLVLDLFDPLLDQVVSTGVPARPGRGEAVHPETGNRVSAEVTVRDPDPARQLIRETWTFREHAPSGEIVRSEDELLELRWSLRDELRWLFELVGLAVVAEYGDFRGGPPAYGREQIWVLRRTAAPDGSHRGGQG